MSPYPERFNLHMISVDEQGCWLWLRHLTHQGYAGIGDRLMHREVYELVNGPIPEGLQIDHLCRVRHCVNPTHLEPVTQAENIARGFAARGVASTCRQGHDWSIPGNVYPHKDGNRRCRACRLERNERLRLRREREAAA